MAAGTVFLLFTVVALAPGTHKWSEMISQYSRNECQMKG